MASKIKLPSTPVGRRRLLKLAALLEKDAKNKKGIKFDLRMWGEARHAPGMNCGTTACAMGLAALSGAFARQGLKVRISGDNSWGYDISVRLGQSKGADAAARLFEIKIEEAKFLFFSSCYPPDAVKVGADGERTVAARIRDFVAGEISP